MAENTLLNNLLNAPNLKEIISQPTTYRQEKSSVEEDFNVIQSNTDFEQPIIEQEPILEQPKQNPIQQYEDLEEYDAEKNAKAMVYGLQAIEALILNPIAIYKHRNTSGGKEVINQMKEAFKKSRMGEELDEKEQRLLLGFEKYQKEVANLTNELIPGQQKIDELIRLAIPYCEENQFKIGSGAAFWMTYGAGLAGRITQILLK